MNALESWKTTVVGFALILIGIFGLKYLALDTVTAGAIITTGLGFIVAKDSNVSGSKPPSDTNYKGV